MKFYNSIFISTGFHPQFLIGFEKRIATAGDCIIFIFPEFLRNFNEFLIDCCIFFQRFIDINDYSPR
jgi:hypothetical protein